MKIRHDSVIKDIIEHRRYTKLNDNPTKSIENKIYPMLSKKLLILLNHLICMEYPKSTN